MKAFTVSARTYPLGLGTFAVGTSGYSVAGLLPAMSTDLRMPPAMIGQLITVFALACAVASPLVAAATPRWERRNLLVAALLVAAFGNLLAASVPSFGLLVAARLITAVGAATYTAGAVAVAGRINTPQVRARAMSVVFGGLTLALLLGVPASGALAATMGYPTVFLLIAAVCTAAAVVITLVVPTVPSHDAGGLRARLTAARDQRIAAVLTVSLLAVMATFTIYTYIGPMLTAAYGATGLALSAPIAGYGLGALAGNLIGGIAADRQEPRLVVIAALGCCVVVLLVLPFATTPAAAFGVLALWGCAFWMINAPIASWLAGLTGANAPYVLALNASAIHLGMAAGGLLGGLVVTWAGAAALAAAAAVMTACAGTVLLTTPSPAVEGRPL